MKNNIFLFSHQDDEIAVFKTIKDILNRNEKIFIFFLTNGNISNFNDIDLISKRENESKKVLEKIGVKSENITFLGKSLGINSYNLLGFAFSLDDNQYFQPYFVLKCPRCIAFAIIVCDQV